MNNIGQRGKITRQELHKDLIDELDKYSQCIVSTTEPIENLRKNLLWFNPIENSVKIYHQNRFIEFIEGNSENKLRVINKRLTLYNSTNQAEINIPEFNKEKGNLIVISNGLTLYPEDYKISEDNKFIIKTQGNWNEKSSRTDFLFTYMY